MHSGLPLARCKWFARGNIQGSITNTQAMFFWGAALMDNLGNTLLNSATRHYLCLWMFHMNIWDAFQTFQASLCWWMTSTLNWVQTFAFWSSCIRITTNGYPMPNKRQASNSSAKAEAPGDGNGELNICQFCVDLMEPSEDLLRLINNHRPYPLSTRPAAWSCSVLVANFTPARSFCSSFDGKKKHMYPLVH